MIDEREMTSELQILNPQCPLEGENSNRKEGNHHQIRACSKFISVQKVTFYGIGRINHQKGVF